jgi:mono/diheme cytochrome c family protein
MKKILKWVLIVLGSLMVLAFMGFLYFIPPFELLPREAFIQPHIQTVEASLQEIGDPVQRLLAERGRYIVGTSVCNDCHTPIGEQGPKVEEFLAGGVKLSSKAAGTAFSRNLTPHTETGLSQRTDEQVKRVLRSGVGPDGRIFHPTYMPWPSFSKMTDEDLHAVLVYLRNIKPIKHEIPQFTRASEDEVESFYGFDFGKHPDEK